MLMSGEFKLYLPNKVFHVKSWSNEFDNMYTYKSLWSIIDQIQEVDELDDETHTTSVTKTNLQFSERPFHLKVFSRYLYTILIIILFSTIMYIYFSNTCMYTYIYKHDKNKVPTISINCRW